MQEYEIGGWRWPLSIALACGGAIVLANSALAQNVTLDGTLGPAEVLAGPIYVIPQAGGKSVGSNLFHSFGRFSLATGEAASFQSAASIQNILARVTGGVPSAINGLIATQSSNVNLFLINPSGILFGPNAFVDVGGLTRGSFVATTTDAIVFPNSGTFSAINPGAANSLLTLVGDPSGFLASQRALQPVTITGSYLAAYPGQSLVFLGGNVDLNGATLQATDGRIELGGVAGVSTVKLSSRGNSLQLEFPAAAVRLTVTVRNGSTVGVTGQQGGSIAVNAQDINVSGRSFFNAGLAEAGGVGVPAGDITLNASRAVNLSQSSLIRNTVRFNAIGNGGDININAGLLSVNSGAQLGASTLGQGNAGNITIQAQEAVRFDGFGTTGFSSGAFSNVGGGAIGQGGNIRIAAQSVSMTNGAELIASTFGQGSAGTIAVQARDTVVFDGVGNNGVSSGIGSNIGENANGNGANIGIMAASFAVTNGAILGFTNLGRGNAGTITIQARDAVSFAGTSEDGTPSRLLSTVAPNAIGNGSNTRISTGSLTVTDGALLAFSTLGQGNAGNLIIQARDSVLFQAGFATSEVSSGAIGQGGNINITTGSFSAINAQLTASTRGQGKAGNVTIQARDQVSLDGLGIFSSVESGAVGKGGNINVTAGSLAITGGAQLAAGTRGEGDAGNIIIQARNQVVFDGVDKDGFASGAVSTVEPRAVGKGGNITISAESFSVKNGAILAASSVGRGGAGDINITAKSVALDNQGSIQATNAAANGGNIVFQLQDLLLLRRGSSISTTAGTAQAGGNGGNITIDAPFVVAVSPENSDISANAFTGAGGRVNINAQGVFGIQPRPFLTSLSDITASSEFGVSGVVTINTPDVDPSRGLTVLPVTLTDPANQIAQGCNSRQQSASSFIATGRGGLPPSPTEPLTHETVLPTWVTLLQGNREQKVGDREQDAAVRSVSPAFLIVEAQGWMMDNNGDTWLVANAPTVAPHEPPIAPIICNSDR